MQQESIECVWKYNDKKTEYLNLLVYIGIL